MTTIGVLGGRWRATVSATGSVEPWDGSRPISWFIAADDRWYVPASEPTVRQRRIEGTPVLETRVKVPGGDAVERVWCVAEHGGLTVIEIENDSSLPFAVAFDRNDLLSTRAPTDVPIQGIELPVGSIVLPVGHRSSIRVALRHDEPASGPLPERLPSANQVARGWTAVLDRAGRVVVPDASIGDEIARTRGELALVGPTDPADDATGFLLDVAQLVRLGERAEPWVVDVADAVSVVARQPKSWDTLAALDGAAIVLSRARDSRAVRDVMRLRAADVGLPGDPEARRWLTWREQSLARAKGDGTADLLAGGLPASWLGSNIEVYGLPIGPATSVSYALRWHGERPAVLWEIDGPLVPLVASVIAPQWSTAEPQGEALWPSPPAVEPSPGGDGI